jgi:hypothetical protein
MTCMPSSSAARRPASRHSSEKELMVGVVIRFASLYTAIVFALGFGLGALRIVWLAPAIGAFWAVIVEVPIMLVFSSIVAAWLVRRWRLLNGETGIEIGIVSFLLLQVVESLLVGLSGPVSFTNNVLIYWGDLSSPRLIGLAGQLLFAALPFIHIWRVSAHGRT